MKLSNLCLTFSVLVGAAACSEGTPSKSVQPSTRECDSDEEDDCCDPEDDGCDETGHRVDDDAPGDDAPPKDDEPDEDAGPAKKPDTGVSARPDAKIAAANTDAGTASPLSADAGGAKPAADGGAVVEAGEPCTGKMGAKSGTLTHPATNRQYLVHVPAGLEPNEPVPVVFVVHGFTMTGPQMQQQTQMDKVADADKFIVIYPTSPLNPWNVGENVCSIGAAVNMPLNDDFKFFEDMVVSVEAGQCVNRKQVFVTGFSMGGYFSNNIGCKKGNSFVRAVGPASGGTYVGECEGAPLPVMLMHGMSDTFIDYNLCGKGARDLWIMRNKCSTEFETKPSGRGSCDWYKDCDPNGQTVFCSYPVAHSWGGQDATKEIWSFFKSYL